MQFYAVFKQTDPSAAYSLFATVACFSFLTPLFVFVSSLPSSKSYVWPCVCPQQAPSLPWLALTSSLGGRWQGRRVAHLVIHLCTIGWVRQIGSQKPFSLLDGYFWPHCAIWPTLLKKQGLCLLLFVLVQGEEVIQRAALQDNVTVLLTILSHTSLKSNKAHTTWHHF